MSESQQGPEICDVISRKRYSGLRSPGRSNSTYFRANYHVNLTDPIFLADEYRKRTQVIFSPANPFIQTLFIRSISLKA